MKKFRNWTLVRIKKNVMNDIFKNVNTKKLHLPQNTQNKNIKNKTQVRRTQIKNSESRLKLKLKYNNNNIYTNTKN